MHTVEYRKNQLLIIIEISNMKSEKEKMLLGEIYNANNDAELIKDRQQCKAKCSIYNNINPLDAQQRHITLQDILGKMGKNIVIEPNFWCDYGYNIEVGENFYANHNLTILDGAKITIGSNVFIGPNCTISSATHPTDILRRNQGLEFAHPITIGSNVWLGAGVTILPGVTIGSGSTIGAGSIVVRDIPANVIAVGNPCKVIKELL